MRAAYCPVCGNALKEKPWEDGLSIPICTSCGRKVYSNSKPCVAGIVLNKRSVLLTKRIGDPYAGFWDLPGGFLRNGEEPLPGLKRELAEELGVGCRKAELFGIFVDTYGEKDVYTFNVCYLVSLEPGEITPMDDVAEASWFSIDSLPDNLAFSNLRSTLENVRETI